MATYNVAKAVHTHVTADVTDLQAKLDSKQASGSYATTSALSSGLAGKANTSHTHTIANVTGLQAALDGAANTFRMVVWNGTAWPARSSLVETNILYVGGTARPDDASVGNDAWVGDAA